MKMRELEQRTGVRREMIQFYFRNGLLPEPERPKPNVADYGDEHVRGILAIRRLQSEQRLSIEEIKRALNGHAAAMPAHANTYQHLDELVAARLGADETLVPLSTALERNPKAEHDARILHKVGAIELVTRKGGRFLSRMDAQIVAIWGDMRAAGYREDTGFEASVTALYVQRAKDLAKAEISAFLERVPDYPPEQKAEFAQVGMNHMWSLFSLLRLKAAIREFRDSGL
jgi:DNA-binding transcriptional MerR regulator